MEKTVVGQGFEEHERGTVAALYWAAFGSKLRLVAADDETGIALIAAALRPDRTLVARRGDSVVGVCGFYRDGIGALRPTWAGVRERLGRLRALRALVVLALLKRPAQQDVLVLDGLCVAATHRGRGIGTDLLEASVDLARDRGDGWVQLSVIEGNPRAEQLYLRRGFEVVEQHSLGALRRVFGFGSYRTLQRAAGQ